jgi:2-iminobutanoate/2-iminopropanoate deaminase
MQTSEADAARREQERSGAASKITAMPRLAITAPGGAPPSGAYSQAIEAGGFIYVSGQGPLDPKTGAVVGAAIEEQVRATLGNIAAILAAASLTLDDVVKVTAYLSDIGLFERYDAVYRTMFTPPFPARTTVGAQLHEMLVEIDVVARRPRARKPR